MSNVFEILFFSLLVCVIVIAFSIITIFDLIKKVQDAIKRIEGRNGQDI